MRTYVFDASALFAFLEHRAGGPKVRDLLKEAFRGHCRILLSAVNCGEVYSLLLRENGEDKALRTINIVRSLPIELQDANLRSCLRAAEVKSRFGLYYVDAFAASLAIDLKATLVTSDSDFRRLGHNVPVIWLKAH